MDVLPLYASAAVAAAGAATASAASVSLRRQLVMSFTRGVNVQLALCEVRDTCVVCCTAGERYTVDSL